MKVSDISPLALLAACLFTQAAAAQSNAIIRIKPATPAALQPVSVEVLAPGCGFLASSSMERNVITLRVAGGLNCSPPPMPTPHEVSIGSLPAGDYQVVLEGSNAPAVPFSVAAGTALSDRAFVQTGIWWDPRFPGTGLTIVDRFPERRVISFATHDALRRPVTYTLVLEQGAIGGTLYRAESTPAAAVPPTPDVALVPAGRATLLSLGDGTLLFDYAIDPLPGHRLVLQRFPL